MSLQKVEQHLNFIKADLTMLRKSKSFYAMEEESGIVASIPRSIVDSQRPNQRITHKTILELLDYLGYEFSIVKKDKERMVNI